jgi:hypothetical protein
VRTIRSATEAEVLESFWAAELAPASRWSADDVESRKLAWRDREGLFLGFPDDVAWERAALTRNEALEILYINWDWWLTVTNGTRLATVAAEVQGRDEGERAIAAAAATNPELVVVTDPARTKLVLLEGYVRLTAYAAFSKLLPDALELYLGVSSRIAEWCQW